MAQTYVCRDGKLVQRDPQKLTLPIPKIISYTHTIRQIYQDQCNCKHEISVLKSQFQMQLGEKDKQIEALVGRIVQKEIQINKLQEEIESFRNSHTPASKCFSNNQNSDPAWHRIQKSLNSTTVSSFSLCDYTSNQNIQTCRKFEILKTQSEMDECLNKTNLLMNQIQGIMKKKRKYQFYNTIHVENSIIEELQNSEEKSQQDTQDLIMDSHDLILDAQYPQIHTQDALMDDIFCPPRSEYNYQDSLDITNYESDHNYAPNQNDSQFYDKILNESIILKHTIFQMREQSVQQIEKMQAFYKKRLQIAQDQRLKSSEQLQRQRKKNLLLETTKLKLEQISDRGRQALLQLNQDENSNWDVKELNSKRTPLKNMSHQILNE